MRTKALLALAAAAIAIPASAQVYSANVVGYYNVPTPGNLTAMSVSLKKDNNRADQVIPYVLGDNIQVWNGAGWTQYTMDDLSATGWVDSFGNDVPVENLPTLGPGKGFFYGKASAVASVTFVGEVPSGTNTVAIPNGLSAVGSQLPVGGLITSVGNQAVSGVNLQVPLGSNVQFWNGSGWTQYSVDDLSATGWVDSFGADAPVPSVTVGQGFFIGNQGAAFNWEQWYNN